MGSQELHACEQVHGLVWEDEALRRRDAFDEATRMSCWPLWARSGTVPNGVNTLTIDADGDFQIVLASEFSLGVCRRMVGRVLDIKNWRGR